MYVISSTLLSARCALVAEGKKESAILEAEAEKEAAILRAEAKKEAMIREAEGRAEALGAGSVSSMKQIRPKRY